MFIWRVFEIEISLTKLNKKLLISRYLVNMNFKVYEKVLIVNGDDYIELKINKKDFYLKIRIYYLNNVKYK